MSVLKEKYVNEIVPQLQKELKVLNRLRVPRLSKVVVNMGLGILDKDALAARAEELSMIAGQRATVTKARKSISNFKLRQGMSIGAKVTLRRDRMYDFLERLIHAALPRIRDFRGLSPRGFDGQGNYTMGIVEQTIFPEIDPNNVSVNQGMNVTIVTTAKSKEGAGLLLRLLGMPFASE